SVSTLLGHSAAVLTMYDVVKNQTLQAARNSAVTGVKSDPGALYSQDFYGGSTSYFGQDWSGLWILDGVTQPGRGYSPTKGSAAASAWLGWLSGQAGPRRRGICAVYTDSGIAPLLENGLVLCLPADLKSGMAGRVVEKRQGQIVWLRFSDGFL